MVKLPHRLHWGIIFRRCQEKLFKRQAFIITPFLSRFTERKILEELKGKFSFESRSSERGITKIFVRNFAPIIFLQFFAYLILTPLCKYLAELGCPRRKSCFCWSTAPIASHYGGLEYCRWFYCTRPLVPTEWHSIYWCFTGHINPLWGLISPSD